MSARVAAGRTAGLRHVEHVMGTVFSIDVRDDVLPQAVDHVVAWLNWVDRTFSTYRQDSQVSRLNRGELRLGGCAEEVREVLDLCARAERATDGYFSARRDGRLDPTGLVKGWAVHHAARLLRIYGSHSHSVNGGGDVVVGGEPEPGRPWRVGVDHPLRRGSLATVVSGVDLAVATSGTAQRGPHVVDPHTGRAVTELAGVTVVGPDLALADAYATAATAMGTAAYGWLAGLDGHEAYVVARDGRVWTTPGFARYGAPAAAVAT